MKKLCPPRVRSRSHATPPAVLRGQCVKVAGGFAVPITSGSDRIIGFALSDADMTKGTVTVWISYASVEMRIAADITIALGDLLYPAADATVTNVAGLAPAIGVAVNPGSGMGYDSTLNVSVEMAILNVS